MKRFIVFAFLLGLLLPVGSEAGLSRFFELPTAEEVLQGDPAGTSVDAWGWIRPAPVLKSLETPEEDYLLAAITVGEWTYLATGSEGRLYRVSPEGTVELVLDTPEELLIALLPDRRDLLVGTGPDGLIYRVDREGTATTLVRTEAAMVTALVRDARGDLVAGTAGPGRVLRIDPNGESKVLYEPGDEDVADLARRGDQLLVGTSGRGRLVALEGAGPRVLFEAPQEEVAPILVRQDGSVLFAAAPIDIPEGGPRSSGTRAPRPNEDKDPTCAVLYRMDAGGRVSPQWIAPEAPIFGIAPSGEDVLVACGMSGRLHRVHPDGRSDLLRAPLEAPISVLRSETSGDWLLGTSQPMGLFRLSRSPESEGEYTSPVFDAEGSAEWGRLLWDQLPAASRPKTGSIRLETRTGNTRDPDDGWSPWTAARGEGGSEIASPVARFMQWRVLLGESAAVRNVRAAYLGPNRPPRITELTVHPQSMGVFEPRPNSSHQLTQELPGGLRIEYHFPGKGGLSKGRWLRLKGLRTVSWTAEDADEDVLRYRLDLRRLGGQWIELEPDYSETYYSFDTARFADGRYELRLRVTDARSNPTGRAGSDIWTSLPFVIDNTPPRIEKLRVERTDGDVEIRFQAVDEGSRIQLAAYSSGGEEWQLVLPEDQVLDERSEEIRLRLEAPGDLEDGLVVRIADEAENVLAQRILVPSDAK